MKRPTDAPKKLKMPLPKNADPTAADIAESAASRAACSDTVGNRRLNFYILLRSVRTTCVVNAEHVHVLAP